MGLTLGELDLKLNSEIAAASSKDVAAIQRVQREVASAQKALVGYQGVQSKAAAERVAAEREQAIAASQLANARGSDVARRQAAFAAASKAATAAGAREAAAAARTAQAAKNARELVAAQPRLEALAVASARAKDEAKDLAEQQAFAAKTSATTGAAFLSAGIEVTKYAALAVAAAAAVTAAFALQAASIARASRLLGVALTGSAELGAEFNAIVRQLAQETPLAREQIEGMAQSLSLLNLGRRDLQAGLTAISFTTSALGESAGAAVRSIVEATAATGRFTLGVRNIHGEFTALQGSGIKSADVLAALATGLSTSIADAEMRLRQGAVSRAQGLAALEAATRARFGGTVAAQMLDFGVVARKARENFTGMFAGINLEPLLIGFRELASIFDVATVRGKVMQALLETTFGGLATVLGALLPVGKEIFLGMAIGALKLAIVLKPIARDIGNFLASLGGAKNALTWVEVGKFLFAGLATTIALVGAAVAIAFIPLAVLGGVITAAFYGIYRAIAFVAGVVGAVRTAIGDATAYVASMDWSDLGANLVTSLIAGIKNGAGTLLASVASLGTSAIGAFKAAVGIASPSKPMLALGENLAASAAMGVDRGAPELESASEDLGGAALGGVGVGFQRAAPGGGAPAGQSITVHMSIQHLSVGGRDVGPEDRQSLADALVELIKTGLAQGSAGEPIGAF